MKEMPGCPITTEHNADEANFSKNTPSHTANRGFEVFVLYYQFSEYFDVGIVTSNDVTRQPPTLLKDSLQNLAVAHEYEDHKSQN